MLSRLLVVALLFSCSVFAQINISRQTVYTVTTVAGLPVTGRTGQAYLVQNSADGSCTLGGGSLKVICIWDGAWSVYGGGTGGGTDDQTATEVPFTPYSTIAATNVQTAIQEVLDEATSGVTSVNGDGGPSVTLDADDISDTATTKKFTNAAGLAVIAATSGTNTGDQTTITGNAGTATALAANGTNCSPGSYPLGVDASGNAEDCTVSGSGADALGTGDPGANGLMSRTALNVTSARSITGTASQVTVTNGDGVAGNPTLSLPATINVNTSGNAATATALAANPTDCAGGLFATTIAANGNLTCAAVAYSDVTGTPTLRYQVVQDEGTPLTVRGTLNFAGAGVTCADDTDRTTCTISGGGGGSGDVTGPGSSTANRIPVWDGTGGDTLKNVPASIDANGFPTFGIGWTTGWHFDIGSDGDTAASGFEVKGGDVDAEPGYGCFVQGDASSKQKACIFSAVDGVNGRLAISGVTPTADSSDYILTQMGNACVDAVGTDSYACAPSPSIGSYVDGHTYKFKAGTANTGTATLALNGLAATNILDNQGAALTNNCITAGEWFQVTYDGTNMLLSSPCPGSASGDDLGAGDPGANGFMDRTALDTTVARTLTGTASEIAITNGGGGGNPVFSLDASVVQTDKANTFGAFAQDFGAATSLKAPTSAGAAPTASGLIAYDSTANAWKVGVNGVGQVLATLNQTQTFENKTLNNASFVNPVIGATDWTTANHAHAGSSSGGTIAYSALTGKPTFVKSFVVRDPATGDTGLYQTPLLGGATTITKVACWTDVGTSVTINLYERAVTSPNAGTTELLSADLVCNNDTTPDATTSFADAAIAAESRVVLAIDAVSGTPAVVGIDIYYTVN